MFGLEKWIFHCEVLKNCWAVLFTKNKRASGEDRVGNRFSKPMKLCNQRSKKNNNARKYQQQLKIHVKLFNK